MKAPAHPPEEADLYRVIASGDVVARNRMAERHFGLVPAVATYYATRNPHLEMEDLLQEGRFGIVWALERFNVDKGWKFSTYATWWIRHFIQRFVIANHSGGLSPKRKDTEDYVGLRMDEAERALYEQRCIETSSMDDSYGDDETRSLDSTVTGDDPDDVELEVMDALEIAGALRVLCSDLVGDTERRIVAMRYGVLGQRPQTVPQVARRTGLRIEVVMKLEQDTIDLIHDLLENE